MGEVIFCMFSNGGKKIKRALISTGKGKVVFTRDGKKRSPEISEDFFKASRMCENFSRNHKASDFDKKIIADVMKLPTFNVPKRALLFRESEYEKMDENEKNGVLFVESGGKIINTEVVKKWQD